jgi:hypothetical protein
MALKFGATFVFRKAATAVTSRDANLDFRVRGSTTLHFRNDRQKTVILGNGYMSNVPLQPPSLGKIALDRSQS